MGHGMRFSQLVGLDEHVPRPVRQVHDGGQPVPVHLLACHLLTEADAGVKLFGGVLDVELLLLLLVHRGVPRRIVHASDKDRHVRQVVLRRLRPFDTGGRTTAGRGRVSCPACPCRPRAGWAAFRRPAPRATYRTQGCRWRTCRGSGRSLRPPPSGGTFPRRALPRICRKSSRPRRALYPSPS